MTCHGLEIPTDRIAEFCRRNRIGRLAIFGSVLRDDFHPASDVDVLVEFLPEAKIGLRFFALQRELSEIIGRKVDLNTPGFLDRYYRNRLMHGYDMVDLDILWTIVHDDMPPLLEQVQKAATDGIA